MTAAAFKMRNVPDCYGIVSNGGTHPYKLGFMSTTGFVAFKSENSPIRVVRAKTFDEKWDNNRCKSIIFWSCFGPYLRPEAREQPSGELIAVCCQDNRLTRLDLTKLPGIRGVFVKGNKLRSIDLSANSGLADENSVDLRENPIEEVILSEPQLKSGRLLGAFNNQIKIGLKVINQRSQPGDLLKFISGFVHQKGFSPNWVLDIIPSLTKTV